MAVVLIPFALAFPFVSIMLIVLYHKRSKNSGVCALLFGLAMAAMFYGYKADVGADIYRHIYWLARYKDVPLFQCFDAGHYKNLFVWDIWCWIISHLGNPLLLQASGAFVTFSLVSYMLFDTARRHKASSCATGTILCFMFCLLRTRDVILGIRSAAAFSLLAFAVYRLYVQKKGKVGSILIAVAASLIHLSAAQFLLLLLLMPVLKRNPKKTLAVLFAIAVCIGGVSSVGLQYIPDNGTLLATVIRAGLTQAAETTEMEHTLSLNSWVNKWWEVGTCILICIRVVVFDKANAIRRRNKQIDEREIWGIALMCFAVNFGYCISFRQNGDRMLTVNEVLMLPYLFYSFIACPLLKNRCLLFIDCFLCIGVVGLLLLHTYSLMWGTASAMSLVEGVLFGIVPALIDALM